MQLVAVRLRRLITAMDRPYLLRQCNRPSRRRSPRPTRAIPVSCCCHQAECWSATDRMNRGSRTQSLAKVYLITRFYNLSNTKLEKRKFRWWVSGKKTQNFAEKLKSRKRKVTSSRLLFAPSPKVFDCTFMLRQLSDRADKTQFVCKCVDRKAVDQCLTKLSTLRNQMLNPSSDNSCWADLQVYDELHSPK